MNKPQATKPALSRRDVLLAGFVAVTVVAFVMAWAFPVWPGDEALLVAVQNWQSPVLDEVSRVLTRLWYPAALTLSVAVVIGLLLRGLRADALLLAAILLTALPAYGLKAVIGRPRPDYALIATIPDSMGFPSGHAVLALLLGGVLIYLAWQYIGNRRLRWSGCAGLGLLILAVGLSRVYLGLHWPSDVVGGYLYGATALLAAARVRDAVLRWRKGRAGEDTTLPKVGI